MISRDVHTLKKILCVVSILMVGEAVAKSAPCGLSATNQVRRRERKPGHLLDNPFKDAFLLNFNLLSWDSLKIIAYSLPIYGFFRAFDDKIQCNFYDKKNHKNVWQMPSHCHDVAAKGIGVPIVLSMGLAVFSPHEETRQTARVFLLGLPFVLFGKDLLKKWEADHCLRPKNGHFDASKKYHGGFPSGHMAEAIFATVLFGKRFGPVAAVPLGIYSTFLAGTFINCNRHYASQLAAGAALGAIYAVAANKLVESKLGRDLQVDFGVDSRGANIKIGCSF